MAKKTNIHPAYHELKLKLTNGDVFVTHSCSNAGHLILEADIYNHPAWRKDMSIYVNKNAGEVAKFNAKFAGLGKLGGMS